jgi:hypothetical protein
LAALLITLASSKVTDRIKLRLSSEIGIGKQSGTQMPSRSIYLLVSRICRNCWQVIEQKVHNKVHVDDYIAQVRNFNFTHPLV